MSKRRDLKALFLTTFVALSPPAWINATPASGGNPQEANHLRQDGRAMLRGVGSPLAATAADQGRMQRDRRLTNLTLRLKRSPEQREALDLFIAQQQNPRSPNRKRWLTPEQVGDLYGPSKNDVAKAVNWLSSQGFQVDRIANARNSIKFSGSVDAIEHAFGTQVHSFRVGEDSFPAIVGDASVPSDLQDVVSGVVLAIPIAQLNVRAKTPSSSNGTSAPATIEIRPEMTFPDGTGDQFLIVTPQDFATIYNVRPAWSGGLTGQGQTIAIPSSTNVRADDWLNFRRLFGLPSVPLTTIHPSCANPGFNANWMAEAPLDVQWAGAAAPGATIQLASCPDGTNVTGAITALENLIDSSTSPPIIAWSYGTCEATLDPQSRDWIRDMFQQAAAQGTSVFVAAGDQGPGFCEPYAAWMKNGIDINAWAATPYAVAVGATDFSEVYSGTQAQYWDLSRRSTSSNFYQSALSYVPEMTWNSSCASPQVYEKFNPFQGRTRFCNSAWNVGRAYAGGGGASRFEPKPLWQAGILGNPNDQKRGIPDVSLFGATSDWWKHAIVYCVSNPLSVSSTCNYDGNNIMAAGGTSFSAPAFAGIQALINQKLGSRQGNLNYALY
jgi:subtilase family serine protease